MACRPQSTFSLLPHMAYFFLLFCALPCFLLFDTGLVYRVRYNWYYKRHYKHIYVLSFIRSSRTSFFSYRLTGSPELVC